MYRVKIEALYGMDILELAFPENMIEYDRNLVIAFLNKVSGKNAHIIFNQLLNISNGEPFDESAKKLTGKEYFFIRTVAEMNSYSNEPVVFFLDFIKRLYRERNLEGIPVREITTEFVE